MVLGVYRPWWTSTRIQIRRPHLVKQTLFSKCETTAILLLYRTAMAGLWTDKGQCGAKDHYNTFNGYELSFIILREVDQHFQCCSCQLRYILDNRGVRYFAQGGVNFIISLLKLVYINLLLFEGLAVLPRGIFIDYRWMTFSLIQSGYYDKKWILHHLCLLIFDTFHLHNSIFIQHILSLLPSGYSLR